MSERLEVEVVEQRHPQVDQREPVQRPRHRGGEHPPRRRGRDPTGGGTLRWHGAGGTAVAGSGVPALLANLTAECGAITYEDDCYAAVRQAATAVSSMSAADQAQVRRRLREAMGANPGQAARIREIAGQAGLAVDTR